MDDSIRPSKAVFQAMYERGYRTWAGLWGMSTADGSLLQDDLDALFPTFWDHPYFPEDLEVDRSFSNTVTVSGRTSWATAYGPTDLPAFQEEVVIQVASRCATTIVFISNPPPTVPFASSPDRECNHIPVLMLDWAYVLSARWAELIPDACPPTYTNNLAQIITDDERPEPGGHHSTVVVNVGEVDGDAAR